jgi:uncharacterized protein
MPSEPVTVRYTKWDGSLHWHFDMWRLGEDEHGVWLGAPDGTALRRGDDLTRLSPPFALLAPPGAFWTAAFNVASPGDPRPDGWPVAHTDVATFAYDIYVDVCTPAEWEGTTMTAIDLDLDVVRTFGGTVAVHDEDEFDDHRERLGYPDHIVDAARGAAAWTSTAIESGREPFRSVGSAWLKLAVDLR